MATEGSTTDAAAIISAIGSKIAEAKTSLTERIDTVLGKIEEAINRIVAPIQQFISNTITGLSNTIGGWINSISSLIGQVSAKIQALWDWLVGSLENIMVSLQTAVEIWLDEIQRVLDRVSDWFADLEARIRDWIGQLEAALSSLYTSVTEWIERNVIGSITAALEWIKAAFAQVASWITDLANNAYGWIEAAKDRILNGISDAIRWVGERLDEVISTIERGFTAMTEYFSSLAEDVMKFIGDWWVDVRSYLDNLLKVDAETIARGMTLLQEAGAILVQRAAAGPEPTVSEGPK